MSGFYGHLQPWLVAAAVFVAVDLRFGILAARERGEEIRLSRAIRRTVNKALDYLCWVTVAEVLSRTFGVTLGYPMVSVGVLMMVYGIELNSLANNWLTYKRIKGRFDIWKLIRGRGEEERR
ncbi:phage holin family protein [Paramuribaculum intestinale]|uniref:phage holin family protein n=1 Tax=Paramuribaculum intestinale TaxID=2094151 RepID=UPI0025B0FAEA|nr:phage holin family protein [Paramuribaculum intestinale]